VTTPAAELPELLLLRHAKSRWDDGAERDFDRGLARRGERAAAAVGVWLRQHGLVPDLVLCSPAERTRETLAIALGQLGPDTALPAIRYDEALYLATGPEIVERIALGGPEKRRILVVGHQPGLADAALMLGGAPERLRERMAAKFPTGALAHLTWGTPGWDLTPGAGLIQAFVVPKELM
jgi:phosphohistidine phosphatase